MAARHDREPNTAEGRSRRAALSLVRFRDSGAFRASARRLSARELLHLNEAGICPTLSQELIMRTDLRDPPVFEHGDAISALNRREAVGDDDDRAVLHHVL